mgnify:CR=1 FL=1
MINKILNLLEGSLVIELILCTIVFLLPLTLLFCGAI